MTGEGSKQDGKVKHYGITQSAHVSIEKLNLAKQMRKLPTNAEELAWKLLRNRNCCGLKFRRQQIIRGLIIDFYCAEMRLAIELDGEIHQQQVEYDAARDSLLKSENITTLRISNANVEKIPELIKNITPPPTTPHDWRGEKSSLNPLPCQGEGAGGEVKEVPLFHCEVDHVDGT